MRELYFLTYFDRMKDKNIFVGPHVFYGREEYAPNVGFFAANEAENCIDMAKKARHGTFGGVQHFAVVKLRPEQLNDKDIMFYELPDSPWAKIENDTMTQKGKCLECKYCYIHDGGDERQLYCLQTKRGRMLTWTMHTGEVRNGVFIPDSTEEMDKRLKDYMKDRIPPKWCMYRRQK